MSVTAVIVSRAGSVRLPGKALLPFAGTTIVGHKVRQLSACALVDRIVINSDSPAIVAEAVEEGAWSMAGGRDYEGNTREMLGDTAHRVRGDVILWAHPTNPLVSADTYDRAIRSYDEAVKLGFDSLVSVYGVQRHAWFDGAPLNYDPYGERHPLAAECASVWFQDGAIFIQPREQQILNRNFFGARPALFEVPAAEVADIDTAEDYRDAVKRYGKL